MQSLLDSGERASIDKPTTDANRWIEAKPCVSAGALDDHEGDTVCEHQFVNVLSSSWQSLAV